MLTIFTPTYNRGFCLYKLYNSLKRQTCKDFEWIIINDGSTDNTDDLVKEWLVQENGFNIIYKKVNNGGKHRAFNIAVDIASYEYFFCVDSDDYILDDCVEIAFKWIKSIDNRDDIAGVSGLRGYDENTPIGGYGEFEGEFIEAPNHKRYLYNLLSDKSEIYRTEILRKFRFPEFEGENAYLSEEIVWNRIALAGYKIRWYNHINYICNYLEGGITRSGFDKFVKGPKGFLLNCEILKESGFKDMGVYYEYKLLDEIKKLNNENIFNASGITDDKERSIIYEFDCLNERLKTNLNRIVANNIAIYGLGVIGKSFLDYRIQEKIGIELICGVDKKRVEIDGLKVLNPEEAKDMIDTVIVTLQRYDLKIDRELKMKFENVVWWLNHDDR